MRPLLYPVAVVAEVGGAVLVAEQGKSQRGFVKDSAKAVKVEVVRPLNPSDPKSSMKSLLSFSQAGKSPMRRMVQMVIGQVAGRVHSAVSQSKIQFSLHFEYGGLVLLPGLDHFPNP